MKHLKTALKIFLLGAFSIAYAHAAGGEFSDLHLQHILETSRLQNTAGLIYAWSPRMPLSILGAEELSVLAAKLNLPLHIVLDPTALEDDVLATAKNNFFLEHSPKLDSSILIAMNMKIHYPSLILYKNGQLLNPSRPGYDEPERLENYVIQRLK
ncbi:MAG: hypothetical protein JNL11_05050 [Bdellovibrionaceae bacterium]|nr:hypothetical protein [Pseudobdellovibrionaceae bacterium]